jgi:YebC/PmpR family DNA-binding regulatory protein
MPGGQHRPRHQEGHGRAGGRRPEEVTYEGYAPGGVGIVVKVLTDNKNRAAAEIRFVFTRNNSAFAGQGSVSRNFQRKGQILIDENTVAEDKLMELILEAGAEDMTHEDGQYEVLTDPATFNDVLTAIQKAEIKTESAQISLIPTLWMTVNEASAARSVMRFVEGLEDLDDVQDVYTNLDVPENILKELGQED